MKNKRQKFENWNDYNNKILDLAELTKELRKERRILFYDYRQLYYDVTRKEFEKKRVILEQGEDTYESEWFVDSLAIPQAKAELNHIMQEIDIIDDVICSVHKLQSEMINHINSKSGLNKEVKEYSEQYERFQSGEARVNSSMKLSDNRPAPLPEMTQQEFEDELADDIYQDFIVKERDKGWFEQLPDKDIDEIY